MVAKGALEPVAHLVPVLSGQVLGVLFRLPRNAGDAEPDFAISFLLLPSSEQAPPRFPQVELVGVHLRVVDAEFDCLGMLVPHFDDLLRPVFILAVQSMILAWPVLKGVLWCRIIV